jgi:hypothetical protein
MQFFPCWKIVYKLPQQLVVWRCGYMTFKSTEISTFAGGIKVVITWLFLGGWENKSCIVSCRSCSVAHNGNCILKMTLFSKCLVNRQVFHIL